jgi:hypothetical protein
LNRPLTEIQRFKKGSKAFTSYLTGVSLHSHTMHSQERLGRLPTYIAKIPVGGYILEREIGRLHLYEGRIFDFNKFYWTPPLSPRESFELEKTQIEKKLGLAALVSLSDHDNIEAGLHLRMLEATQNAPISVEWTVPYGQTEFHLGIHNLPPGRATEWMKAMQEFSDRRQEARLGELLAELHLCSSVLIVLNHPHWDAECVGPEQHQHLLHSFFKKFQPWIHALELNGMRSRRENREVVALGEATGMPVVSGGDRHGCEPNATLNLTRAATFEEFVMEVREARRSEILLMPQFYEALPLRLMENAWHALADAPGEFGRRHWMTRVFIEEKGETIPLSQFTGTRFHRIIDKFRWLLALASSPALRPALRLPFLGNEEGGL